MNSFNGYNSMNYGTVLCFASLDRLDRIDKLISYSLDEEASIV